MQNLRAAVDLLNEIDPRNFTREERKQMADMVVKLMGIIEGEGTTETSTPTATQDQEGGPPDADAAGTHPAEAVAPGRLRKQ